VLSPGNFINKRELVKECFLLGLLNTPNRNAQGYNQMVKK